VIFLEPWIWKKNSNRKINEQIIEAAVGEWMAMDAFMLE
tara:strand:- start:423 stop:539 length:117 start_codon:yes stop_codon:yes gene_type:complete